ncbi:GNAT family N-acetyltransferase [Streptomyces europaeiscabiei]|uniref:GNAT family N-acetyltransferase n=1 Tax=Streptomyces europaeiscabiei TaxID=146819 RepID=UPI002E0ED6C4|nr:GNAT family N-acetyltransferase [Streptomyces europaeiscabiei]
MGHTPAMVQHGGADLANRWFDEILDLYVEVFSVPPFEWRHDESRRHSDRLSGLLLSEGFALSVASSGPILVGFAYGLSVPPEHQRGFLPDRVIRRIAGPLFHVTDFAVRHGFRGTGIGRSLHDSILRDRPEKWATLTVQPQAAIAISIYQRWGWKKVAQHSPGATGPTASLDVYARLLEAPVPSTAG